MDSKSKLINQCFDTVYIKGESCCDHNVKVIIKSVLPSGFAVILEEEQFNTLPQLYFIDTLYDEENRIRHSIEDGYLYINKERIEKVR